MPTPDAVVTSESAWMLQTRALWIWARHGLYEDDGDCFRCGSPWPCADRVDAEAMLRDLGFEGLRVGATPHDLR